MGPGRAGAAIPHALVVERIVEKYPVKALRSTGPSTLNRAEQGGR